MTATASEAETRDLVRIMVQATVAVLIAASLLWFFSDLIVLAFSAVLGAVLLRSVARRLSRRTRLPSGYSAVIVTLIIVSAIATMSASVGPTLVNESHRLLTEVMQFWHNLEQRESGTLLGPILTHPFGNGSDVKLGTIAPAALSITVGAFGGIVLLIAMTLYLAAAPQLYLEGTLRLVPLGYRDRVRTVFLTVGKTLEWWMLGQLIDMTVVGALSMAGLFVLGIPLPVALGVVAGFFTFIPYVGAFLGGIPAVIVASTMGVGKILWVVGLYTLCHMVEGYCVAPLVMRRTVALPPALTVLSMSIFGTIFGFLGILIATPMTAALIVLIREFYVKDILGDREP